MVDTTDDKSWIDDIKPHWSEAPVEGYLKREPVEDGVGEWIIVRHVTGGETHVYTTKPLVLVDPETH